MANGGTQVTRIESFGSRLRKKFLDQLRNSANVRSACQQAGISRTTAYRHYKEDADFKAQWDEALEEAVDLLEAKAWNNAMKKDSETSLWNLLKAHRPEKYRETVRNEIMGRDGAPIAIELIEVIRKDGK